jgi:hypothetical protein
MPAGSSRAGEFLAQKYAVKRRETTDYTDEKHFPS